MVSEILVTSNFCNMMAILFFKNLFSHSNSLGPLPGTNYREIQSVFSLLTILDLEAAVKGQIRNWQKIADHDFLCVVSKCQSS